MLFWQVNTNYKVQMFVKCFKVKKNQYWYLKVLYLFTFCVALSLFYRETKLGSVESDLKEQLSLANKIIADKLPFIDTSESLLQVLCFLVLC